MKHLFLIISFIFLFSSCSQSSVDDWNNAVSGINPNSKINIKINDTKYQEYTDSSTQSTWSVNNYANGTNNYSINAYVNVIGLVVAFPKQLKINFTGTNIQNGQIINGNTAGFNFTIYGTGLDTSEYHYINGTSQGQIKITYFDGIIMSGEFSFTGIAKYVDNPQVGVNYLNNTVEGTFHSFVKSN